MICILSTEYTDCPSCNAKIKGGLLSSNAILSKAKTDVIKTYRATTKDAYCQKCGSETFELCLAEMKKEIETLNGVIRSNIHSLPVISSHSPQGWEYDVIDMVTAQSVGGTGIVAEFTSSIDDLFGSQSGSLTGKLRGGENICFGILRKKALDLGANAVVATDIDYSELGAIKGMIMVCMAGTAVKLKKLEVIGKSRILSIDVLTQANDRLQRLNGMKQGL